MVSDAEPSEPDWQCGWESHRHAQAARLARLSLSEKLIWLEQAHHLMRSIAGNRPDADPNRAG